MSGCEDINGSKITTIRYADDTVISAKSEADHQRMMKKLVLTSSKYGMDINEEKTKVMIIKKDNIEECISVTVNKHKLEQVKSSFYPGSLITEDGRCLKEISKRIALAKNVFWNCRAF